MYDIKALYEATSVSDAVRLRLEHPEAQIIAGGTDVLVQMREGKRAGSALISIFGLDEIRGIFGKDTVFADSDEEVCFIAPADKEAHMMEKIAKLGDSVKSYIRVMK